METVFITIHDLSPDARIKYCSDSIEDILGYLPHEVKEHSCWDYFHPEEVPFAKIVHGRGVGLDKAAVFSYCQVRHKDGHWIGCECVFTVVYDVLIASTAIYQRGPKSSQRANDGAHIRRIFSSAPKDSRYHMLSYISSKFSQAPQPHIREPRAALFLNRFSRSSTIMFATNGVTNILGLQPNQLVGKSLYYCIAPECLDQAIQCLESAKSNDSIAYMRFWYRDPTREDVGSRSRQSSLPISTQGSASSDDDGMNIEDEDEDEDGGVTIISGGRSAASVGVKSPSPMPGVAVLPTSPAVVTPRPQDEREDHDDHLARFAVDDSHHLHVPVDHDAGALPSRSSSDDSARASQHLIFDRPYLIQHSSASSLAPNDDSMPGLEIEAVVSCTSDGLVVVLRRARPLDPGEHEMAAARRESHGLFAAPWAAKPILPDDMKARDVGNAQRDIGRGKPAVPSFMETIRDVAVFSWSLTGINGSLIHHAHGTPTGEALPVAGLPVWDPTANVDDESNKKWNGFSDSTNRRTIGTEEIVGGNERPVASPEKDSSDDEILWKRVPRQPPWKPSKRRAHQEAFGSDFDADGTSAAPDQEIRIGKTKQRKIEHRDSTRSEAQE